MLYGGYDARIAVFEPERVILDRITRRIAIGGIRNFFTILATPDSIFAQLEPVTNRWYVCHER